MKSMVPSSMAIFFMTYFYRDGGEGMAPSPPRIRYWNTPAFKTNQQNLSCEINNEIQVRKFYLILLLKKDPLRSHVTITKDPLYPNTYLYRAPFCKGPHSDSDIWWPRLVTVFTGGPQCTGTPTCADIWWMPTEASARYASFWNAFLFDYAVIFVL